MERKILIAPSILAADFCRLADEIHAVEAAGADMIHVDVMDGHFVPNITIGPLVVKDIRKATKLPLDVHLMIKEPARYIDAFVKAGSDIITLHCESDGRMDGLIKRVRSLGLKAGISVRPKTCLACIRKYLDKVDMVLVMTVEPGFGGQRFIEATLPKIRELRRIYDGHIEVDGGINKETAVKAVKAGADVLVAGTAVFHARNIKQAIKDLRGGFKWAR